MNNTLFIIVAHFDGIALHFGNGTSYRMARQRVIDRNRRAEQCGELRE